MYYIVQTNLFGEDKLEELLHSLDRLGLEYETIKVLPFVEDFDFDTKRKDVFCFGSLKMARIAKKYDFNPGVLITPNHDFEVYSQHYKDELLNYDSKIFSFGEDFPWEEESYFIRPTLDTKIFTGKVFIKDDWLEFRDNQLTNGHSTVLSKDSRIQVSTAKKLYKEFRFFVVDGKVVTGSLYREGYFTRRSNVIDDGAKEYCQKMVDIFNLAPAFVMDIVSLDEGYKIVECGSVNCAGFYDSNIMSLLIALEDKFSK